MLFVVVVEKNIPAPNTQHSKHHQKQTLASLAPLGLKVNHATRKHPAHTHTQRSREETRQAAFAMPFETQQEEQMALKKANEQLQAELNIDRMKVSEACKRCVCVPDRRTEKQREKLRERSKGRKREARGGKEEEERRKRGGREEEERRK